MNIRRLALLGAALASLAHFGSVAAQVTEIPLPSGVAGPLALDVDASGVVWVGVDFPPSLLAYNGTWRAFDLPVRANASDDSTFSDRGGGRFWGLDVDHAGRAWIADARQGAVYVVDAREDARVAYLSARNATPLGLVVASDGAVWVSTLFGETLAKVDPASLAVTERAAQKGSGPLGVAIDANGRVLVAATFVDRVLAFDPARDDFVTSPTTGVTLSAPYAVLPTATRIVVSEHGTNAIAIVNRSDGSWQKALFVASPEFPAAEPGGLALAPDGRHVWIAVHTANRIARVDLEDLSSVEFEIPSEGFANTLTIAVGPDGRAWFTEPAENTLAYVEPNASAPLKPWIEPTAVLHPGETVVVRVALEWSPGVRPGPLRMLAGGAAEEGRFKVLPQSGPLAAGAGEGYVQIQADPGLPPGRYPFVACADLGAILACAREVASVRPPPEQETNAMGAAVVVAAVAIVGRLASREVRESGGPNAPVRKS